VSAPTPAIDAAAPVREGEALDLAALRRWLDVACPELVGDVALTQFPAGHSNLTYLLTIGDREVVLRRPPFGARIASAHDMGREYRLLSALHPVWPRVPRPLACCDDAGVLGAPFYLMERLRGVIVRKRLPAGVDASPEGVDRLCGALADTLVEVHGVDWRAAGLGPLYKGDGYVARQVSGWTRRYDAARTDDVRAIEDAARWLAANLPTDASPTLIHNDFKHDNLVLDPADPTRVVGLLDWEMATIGDPLMDLGTTLGYWIEATDPPHIQAFAFCPTNVPGAWSRARLVEEYARRSGREVTDPVFYFVYGLFKLAVVAQQIYRRYKLGHTQDERFARFLLGVQVLGDLATRAIDRGRVDRLG
jgi:aminoglycoside phosphotransferase (APT) family kinase protein